MEASCALTISPEPRHSPSSAAAAFSSDLSIGISGSINPFSRLNAGTLVIVPASGLAGLGTTERIKAAGLSPSVVPLTNGIVTPSIIGQENDPARSGDFLTYNSTAGLLKGTYSASTSLQSAGSTAVFNASGPQTLTANAAVYALKNNGQTINLNGKTLTLGSTAVADAAGVICNGGSITGGTLSVASGREIAVYTSLAGGAITSNIGSATAAIFLTTFGSGALTLTGSTFGTILANSGSLRFDGTLIGGIDLGRSAAISGNGKVSGRVAGGTISPGNSAGIFTAGSTAQTTPVSVSTAYAFEFTSLGAPIFSTPTASGNDVLRLTDATAPFGSALTADNEIAVYFNLTTGVHLGDTFFGGFFADKNAAFEGTILGALWRVFLADPLGDTEFNGVKYRASGDSVDVSTVPQTANFGAGNVNGYITRVTIVPEPGVMVSLLAGMAGLLGGAGSRRSHPRR